MIAINDLETNKRINQIGTLKRVGDTRWGSHLSSLQSLMIMFDTTCSILENVIKDGNFSSQMNEVDGTYDIMISFEFVFILHPIKELLGITDDFS